MADSGGGFSFLQFSDLHNHRDKGFDLTLALSRLLDFLEDNKEELPCDYVFITGDIANKCTAKPAPAGAFPM